MAAVPAAVPLIEAASTAAIASPMSALLAAGFACTAGGFAVGALAHSKITRAREERKRVEAGRKKKERIECEKNRLSSIGMDHLLQYNIAFTGQTGVGKSSLINAIRKVRRYDEDYAPVSTGTQGTMQTTSYLCSEEINHAALWDVPGGGTSEHPQDSYFADHCLDLFDTIVLAYTSRMGELGKYILKKAKAHGVLERVVVVYTMSEKAVNDLIFDEGLTRQAAWDRLQKNVTAEFRKVATEALEETSKNSDESDSQQACLMGGRSESGSGEKRGMREGLDGVLKGLLCNLESSPRLAPLRRTIARSCRMESKPSQTATATETPAAVLVSTVVGDSAERGGIPLKEGNCAVGTADGGAGVSKDDALQQQKDRGHNHHGVEDELDDAQEVEEEEEGDVDGMPCVRVESIPFFFVSAREWGAFQEVALVAALRRAVGTKFPDREFSDFVDV